MNPFAQLIRYRIQRAFETLDEARLMAESDHWNGCVNRLYYACFYAVNALLQTNVNSFKLWSLGFEPAVGL